MPPPNSTAMMLVLWQNARSVRVGMRHLELCRPLMQGLEGVLQSSRDSDADSAGFNAVRRLGNGPTATRTRSCAPSTEWEHLSRA